MPKRNGRSKGKGKVPAKGLVHKDLTAIESTLKELVLVTNEEQTIVPPIEKDLVMPYLRRNKVYTFTRAYTGTAVTVTTGLDTILSYVPTLNQFPDSAEFTTLFDSYRIGIVRIAFSPFATQAGPVLANVHTVIDYDDSTGVSLTSAQEYSTYQVNRGYSTFMRVFQPRAANAAYSGVFTSFSQMPPSTWVDVASPNVNYYGLKLIIPASTFAGGPLTIYEVNIQAILQFKNTR